MRIMILPLIPQAITITITILFHLICQFCTSGSCAPYTTNCRDSRIIMLSTRCRRQEPTPSTTFAEAQTLELGAQGGSLQLLHPHWPNCGHSPWKILLQRRRQQQVVVHYRFFCWLSHSHSSAALFFARNDQPEPRPSSPLQASCHHIHCIRPHNSR